jgi:hypothetical protein
MNGSALIVEGVPLIVLSSSSTVRVKQPYFLLPSLNFGKDVQQVQ